ncbi:MAG TPA: TatD family hydrolase [Anaeromyxobacteraceae bacterium]|nr:TatD family hydrolase [Anaeromyxobacteraceae bacterium]
MIDSHCHLDGASFDADREAVLERARRAGVTDVVVPGVEPAGWEPLLRLAAGLPGVHAALGIHPQALPDLDPAGDDRRLADLEALLRRGGAVAVGECGLDGPTVEAGVPLDRQRAVLRGHLDIARRLGLPVILHALRAPDAIREELERDGVAAGGVLHSFSGSPDHVGPLAALGLHFSFAGAITWPGARKPAAAARQVPADRLLVETDAPDQAPHPHRGLRNEPARLPLVLGAVAAARGEAPEEVERVTTGNARRLFRLPGSAP